MKFPQVLLSLSLNLLACGSHVSSVNNSNVLERQHEHKCALEYEALNHVYLQAEPFYSVDACRAGVNARIARLLLVLVKVDAMVDSCEHSDNVEDVVDPILDYAKRSLVDVDMLLSVIQRRGVYGPKQLADLDDVRRCFYDILLLRRQYQLFSLEFAVDDVVFDNLHVKLLEVERSFKEANIMFCIE